jgi:hypothetical protein
MALNTLTSNTSLRDTPTAIELLLLPLFPGGVFKTQVVGWRFAQSFETATHRMIAVPVGTVLFVVALHVLNAFARANASIASSLLGPSSDTVEETAPAQSA